MPVLRAGPSPEVFTSAWADKFEEVVTEAAGRDRRLTIAAAHRIAERTDGGKLFADTAVDYLRDKGQRSVSVGKLLGEVRPAVLDSATQAAGPDGKLSIPDGGRLRSDLREPFRYLRGIGFVDPPPRTAEQLREDVRAVMISAFDENRAFKLSGPPRIVRGRRPILDHVPHEPTNTALTAYIANNKIYVSRSASHHSPLIGWYYLGEVPPPR